eukprot:TRINITY_DN112586_c0_g1_i1.p1 TRINITY_DN112586_c0_g1~~TRINITY_DN112586_c0_g1_i1.p1  ORF type:complete len:265 (+),score=39.74 TRINITY_DN112586_c0_g1_i1:24-797(+)
MAKPERNYGTKWLLAPLPNPDAKTRVFLFHHVGAAPATFMAWMRKMKDVEGLAVSIPGRGARMAEAVVTDIPTLAGQVVDGLGHLMEEKPCILFGHSYGAAVAYEVARELKRREKKAPLHLVLSSRPPPNYVYEDPNHSKTEAQIKQVLVSYGGTPKEILDNADMMKMAYPPLRGDWKANETYVIKPEDAGAVLDVPATLYYGDKDLPEVLEKAEEWAAYFNGPKLVVQKMPGGHFWLGEADQLQVLLDNFNRIAGV